MIFDDDDEYFNPNGRQGPQILLGQIRERGNMSSALAQQSADRDERNSVIVNNVTYGRQSDGPYSMENFIVEVLELDTSDEHVRTMRIETNRFLNNKAYFESEGFFYAYSISDEMCIICTHDFLEPLASYSKAMSSRLHSA